MAPTPSPNRGRRLRLAVAGAAVLTALTVATAGASPPTTRGAPAPTGVQAAGRDRLATGPMGSNDPQLEPRRTARSPAAAAGAFIYRKGRYSPLDALDGRLTSHVGINNRGQIAGSYLPDGMTLRGFVRDTKGTYTGFDAPGARTLAIDLNDQGTAVGIYGVTGDHGFVRRPNGAVATIEVPGAVATTASGINNRGQVVGGYRDANGREHGLLLERGRVTRIDHPESPEDPAATNTAATDINDRGQIVGFYADAEGTYHGYLYDKGRFTRIDPPGAADVARFATTVPIGINNRGQVTGQYVDTAGVLHGYLWEPRRGFKTIEPPGGAATFCTELPDGGRICGTIAVDINDRGQILLPAPGAFFKGRAVPIGG